MTAEDTVSMDVDEKKSEDKKSNSDESTTVTAPKQDDIATILFESLYLLIYSIYFDHFSHQRTMYFTRKR
jgi:hypothetical protein